MGIGSWISHAPALRPGAADRHAAPAIRRMAWRQCLPAARAGEATAFGRAAQCAAGALAPDGADATAGLSAAGALTAGVCDASLRAVPGAAAGAADDGVEPAGVDAAGAGAAFEEAGDVAEAPAGADVGAGAAPDGDTEAGAEAAPG
ncbi:TPA: hypothetical protein SAR15_003009, partial [Burkholderia multivorans]|nr:hypothetical protein [Burkholderia multivorans]